MVVLYHAEVPGFSGGYIGVDVFFVISGFLITQLLLDELRWTGRVSLREFYARRIRRLLPAATLVLAGTLVTGVIMSSAFTMRSVAVDALSAGWFLANFHFANSAADYFTASADPSPVLHYWSLSVEEQFYLLWPVTLLALGRLFRHSKVVTSISILGCLCFVSFAFCIYLTRSHATAAYFLPMTRGWELVAGGLLGELIRLPQFRRWIEFNFSSTIGMVLLVLSCTMLDSQSSFPGYVALVPVASTMLLIGAAPFGLMGRTLSVIPLRVLGRLSYSIYLVHWPVIVFASMAVLRPLNNVEKLLVVATSLVLAYAIYHGVENPMRRARYLRARVRHSAYLGLGGIGVLTLIALLVWSRPIERGGPGPAVHLSMLSASDPLTHFDDDLRRALTVRRVPSNLRPTLNSVLHGRDLSIVYRNGCHQQRESVSVQLMNCTYGKSSASNTIMVVGDSHAAEWFPAFESIARRRSVRLINLTKSNCPPIAMTVMDLRRPYEACNLWKRKVIQTIGYARPSIVAISFSQTGNAMARLGVSNSELAPALGKFVTKIRNVSPRTRVVLMEDNPFPGFSVPACVARNLNRLTMCNFTFRRNKNLRRMVEVARMNGAGFVQTNDLFCLGVRCPAVIGDILVYRDTNHISSRFASWLSPIIESRLDAAAPDGLHSKGQTR
jgi:peptidoglycan/LPS O-acetylase OafA/YrhL